MGRFGPALHLPIFNAGRLRASLDYSKLQKDVAARFNDAQRQAYLREFGAFVQAVKKGCRAQQIDYVQLRTDQSLEVALSTYLASRMNRTK